MLGVTSAFEVKQFIIGCPHPNLLNYSTISLCNSSVPDICKGVRYTRVVLE